MYETYKTSIAIAIIVLAIVVLAIVVPAAPVTRATVLWDIPSIHS